MFKTIGKIIKYPRLTQDYPKKMIESSCFIGRPEIDNMKCTDCGECLKRCPSGAIVKGAGSSLVETGSASRDKSPAGRDDSSASRDKSPAGRDDSSASRDKSPAGRDESSASRDKSPDCKNSSSASKDIVSGEVAAVSASIGINYDECVFCALCEDICPSGAVKMTNKFELAERDRNLLRSSTLIIREADVPTITEDELNNRLSKKIKKMFGRSLQIREVDAGSCNGCDYEINALNNPFNDIERLGIHFVASPRHADLLLVTGTASRNMEQALLKTYEATPGPKLVVAVGACACSGGIFRDSYAANKGIDSLVPVDVYIPGCPPRPQSILYGILKVLDRLK